MVSSPGDDYSEPPRGPAPPASMIAPQGTSTPFKPHFINFLGDTNTPSTGLTPEMLAAIDATNGPAPGAAPPAAAAAAAPPVDQKRQRLAQLLMQAQTPERGYNTGRGGGGGDYGGGRSSSSFGGRAAGGRGAY